MTFNHTQNCVQDGTLDDTTCPLPSPTADIIKAFNAQAFPMPCPNNPTDLTNPYYEWVIRHHLSPYDVEKIFDSEPKPLWAMGRVGQSETLLPDGRVILIGGEYEDYYDPQFAIYNDVIVKYPNGDIRVFGYPTHIFAPTDFHSATLIGDSIYIIGNMGNVDNRHYDSTPIYQLNIDSFKITKIESRNHIGWINSHTATFNYGQIFIQGGVIIDDDNNLLRENIDEYAFNPNTLTFKNLTNHQWQGFLVKRKDDDWLSLFEYGILWLDKQYLPDDYDNDCLQLKEKLGIEPNMELYRQLFVPPINHYQDDNDEYIIWIDGIKVRYVENNDNVQVYIEGQLSDDVVQLLADNLCYKLAKLENAPCQIQYLSFHRSLANTKKVDKKIKKV